MKCVCPMGGDRTCPENCPLAIWANLSPTDRKAQRKAIVEVLYKQGFTMEVIATQLGVSQRQISRDLEDFNLDAKSKLKPAKTASNPKGSGRPKGTNSRRRKNTGPDAAEAAKAIIDGKTYKEAESDSGLSNTVLRAAVAREEGRREAEPTITADMLSMTAQQKLDLAIRQHKRKLDAEFVDSVAAECRKQMDEIWLPDCQKRLDQAEELLKSRIKGAMPRAKYRIILSCLHADSRKSVSEGRLNEAFHAFEKLESVLCSEAEMPTPRIPFPRTWEERMAMKSKVAATRKAKRSNGREISPRRRMFIGTV
jgi:uncharacterized protein YerC